MNWKNTLNPIVDPAIATDKMIEESIRGWRNAQLAVSDWTQLADIPDGTIDVLAWREYRQDLRDMLNRGIPPKEIIFPTPPE